MAAKDHNAAHVEHPEHEALLTGAIALASLFSSCVEAFGLIHPAQKADKEEQLLLTRLGIQQARLLIWGSVLGISSPPACVTNSAVPKHPSSAYPDLNEPTFFHARDPRLDETSTRAAIEQSLGDIVDRSSHLTREEMMARYGLRPPKKPTMTFEPALDNTRLESFREKYELLREVAESLAHINTGRSNSIIHSSWVIADAAKFQNFIALIQEKVNHLIDFLEVKQQVDRGMRMDIRMFGWHVSPDRFRTAQDISKLRLLREICTEGYPEYVVATQQALDNIGRESRENNMPSVLQSPHDNSSNGHDHKKRPGLLKIFRSFGKSKHHDHASGADEALNVQDATPARSLSHPGPINSDDDGPLLLDRVRSKSLGAQMDAPEIEEVLASKTLLSDTTTKTLDSTLDDTIAPPPPLVLPMRLPGSITRHDQYHGIARVQTKDLRQPGGDFSTA